MAKKKVRMPNRPKKAPSASGKRDTPVKRKRPTPVDPSVLENAPDGIEFVEPFQYVPEEEEDDSDEQVVDKEPVTDEEPTSTEAQILEELVTLNAAFGKYAEVSEKHLKLIRSHNQMTAFTALVILVLIFLPIVLLMFSVMGMARLF